MASKKHKFHWEYGQFSALLYFPNVKRTPALTRVSYNAADKQHARVKAVNSFVAQYGFRPVYVNINTIIEPKS